VARIMPIEEGMDAMAKQIIATGRTHSVFDLAWVVLGGMDRFHVIFENEGQPLYRSKSDHSVWLYQKECLAHFWSAGMISKYYDEEIAEVPPPAGNFQSVARCGFSRKLIGPPNHHAYQQNVINLHREQFSNMTLDRYKSRISMEHSEEAVQEWLEGMTKQTRWRPKSEIKSEDAETTDSDKETTTDEEVAPESVAPEALADEAVAPEAIAGEPAVDSTDAPADDSAGNVAEDATPDSSDEKEPSADAETTPEPVESTTPVIEETVVILDNHREVEQHFLAHGFEQEFECGKIASALANIPARMISPGLMALLKNTVTEEKRYPGNLASILCRQMSGRHLAVYKWKKRLHCGPARPKHVPGNMVIADRPAALFQWVTAHPGGNIDAMWKDCLPAEIDDDTRHLWYHDLHWLINEGLVLLFSDGTLHAAKELEKKSAKKSAKKQAKSAKKKSAQKKSTEKPGAKEPAVEEPAAEKPAAEKPAAEKPAAEEPAAEEPAAEKPAAEKPAAEEPAAEEPAAEEPATEEPATEEPATEEPATEEPATEEPATEEPATEELPQKN
jgi:hypothetical protein